jgi:hypothetical protein
MRNLAVNHGSSRAVTTPVGISIVLWEEPNVVSFANNDDRYRRLDIEFLTGICTIVNKVIRGT